MAKGIIVQKFGGSSMANIACMRQVAQQILTAQQRGAQVVAVVSAMAGQTDALLKLAHSIQGPLPARELDQLLGTGEQAAAALLALVLARFGLRGWSLTGAQVGIQTDGIFNKARIARIDTRLLKALLRSGAVPVITGFQGVDAQGNLTTLGRGGSDTSAVAIAAALGADACQIFTDVQGIYTADPRLCKQARLIPSLSYEEMLEMAALGAKVLHIRSVELAMNHHIPLAVRSTFHTSAGSQISKKSSSLEFTHVCGVCHSAQEAKVTLYGRPIAAPQLAQLFAALAAAQVNVDVIVQHGAASSGGSSPALTFTVSGGDLAKAKAVVAALAKPLKVQKTTVAANLAKVSVVGVGMMSHPGVAARFFAALANAKIPVDVVSTSEIKISCLVPAADMVAAVKALHKVFALGRTRKSQPAPKGKAARPRKAKILAKG